MKKSTNVQKLITHSSNQWVKEKIIKKLENILWKMKTKTKHTKKLWDVEKAVQKRKFTAIDVYFKKKYFK